MQSISYQSPKYILYLYTVNTMYIFNTTNVYKYSRMLYVVLNKLVPVNRQPRNRWVRKVCCPLWQVLAGKELKALHCRCSFFSGVASCSDNLSSQARQTSLDFTSRMLI